MFEEEKPLVAGRNKLMIMLPPYHLLLFNHYHLLLAMISLLLYFQSLGYLGRLQNDKEKFSFGYRFCLLISIGKWSGRGGILTLIAKLSCEPLKNSITFTDALLAEICYYFKTIFDSLRDNSYNIDGRYIKLSSNISKIT